MNFASIIVHPAAKQLELKKRNLLAAWEHVIPESAMTSGFALCQTAASLGRYRAEDENFKTASVYNGAVFAVVIP